MSEPDRPRAGVDLLEAIYTTRSIRRFSPEPLPDELVERVLDAAIRAPSGGNSQTWRFVVVRDPTLRAQLGELYRQGFREAYPAAQNLLLAARGLGLGGCLTTLHLRREAQVKELLGIPEAVDTYALIPLGRPASPHGPLNRRPVREVTFLDRWGGRAG